MVLPTQQPTAEERSRRTGLILSATGRLSSDLNPLVLEKNKDDAFQVSEAFRNLALTYLTKPAGAARNSSADVQRAEEKLEASLKNIVLEEDRPAALARLKELASALADGRDAAVQPNYDALVGTLKPAIAKIATPEAIAKEQQDLKFYKLLSEKGRDIRFQLTPQRDLPADGTLDPSRTNYQTLTVIQETINQLARNERNGTPISGDLARNLEQKLGLSAGNGEAALNAMRPVASDLVRGANDSQLDDGKLRDDVKAMGKKLNEILPPR